MSAYTLVKNGIQYKKFDGFELKDSVDIEPCIFAPLWLDQELAEQDTILGPNNDQLIVFCWEPVKLNGQEFLKIHCI